MVRRRGVPAAQGVHLTFGAEPAREMTVSWTTDRPAERPRVIALPLGDGGAGGGAGGGGGARGGAGAAEASAGAEAEARTQVFVDAHDGRAIILHHAPLTGLAAGTRYAYEVRHGRGSGRPVASGTFQTAPDGRAAFTFTSVGDQGTPDAIDHFGSPYSARVTAGIEGLEPLLHLVNGDLTYANMSDDPVRTWRNWFASIEPSAARRPWMPTPGNHEIEPGNGPLGYTSYQARFLLPDNGEDDLARGLWYTFAAGGVRFVALNGDDVGYQAGGEIYLRGYSGGRQTAWLEQTLKQARSDPGTDWIVVFTHQAFCSTAAQQNGSDLGLREAWGPLFDAYEVDLVLCGHDHHYERTHPVRGTVPDRPSLVPRPVSTGTDVIDSTAGTVHLLLGFGGAQNPSNERLFTPPASRTIVGSRPRDDGRGRQSVVEVEPAPWSAVRGLDQPYGFAAFAVDPGEPGGTSRIEVTVYSVSLDADPVAFDRFTLTRPR